MAWVSGSLHVFLIASISPIGSAYAQNCPGGTCEVDEMIHIFNEALIPGVTYTIEVIDESCDPTSGQDQFSAPLELATTMWGDITRAFAGGLWPAPDTAVDVTADLGGEIDAFLGLFVAPIKSRADLAGVAVAPVDGAVNIAGIDLLIDAILGQVSPATGTVYPFPPGAAPCP